MTLRDRTTRTCAAPDCERSTAWPRDPGVVAAFCVAHTDALLIGPREPEPFVAEWRKRLTARDETGAVLAR